MYKWFKRIPWRDQEAALHLAGRKGELELARSTIGKQAKRIQELEALATERKEIADNLADGKADQRETINDLEARIRELTDQNQALNMEVALASPDPADWIAACDNKQATRAQFRLLKQKVVSLQTFCDAMLAGLDKLGRANVVTKEDLRKLRQFRDDLKVARETGVIESKEVEVDGTD